MKTIRQYLARRAAERIKHIADMKARAAVTLRVDFYNMDDCKLGTCTVKGHYDERTGRLTTASDRLYGWLRKQSPYVTLDSDPDRPNVTTYLGTEAIVYAVATRIEAPSTDDNAA